MKYKIILALLVLLGAVPELKAETGPWNFLMQLPTRDSGLKLDRPVAIDVDSESRRYYVVDPVGGTLLSFDRDGKHLAAFNAGRFSQGAQRGTLGDRALHQPGVAGQSQRTAGAAVRSALCRRQLDFPRAAGGG